MKKDKRTQLLEATIELFSKEGFWNTSTARISRHAKVATGTLFNYFESKEVLIDEVYLLLKRELADFILPGYPAAGDTVGKFRHIWTRYAEWSLEFPDRYILLNQLRLSDLVSQEAEDRLAEELAFMFELVGQAHEEGLFGDLEIGYVSLLIHAELEAAINHARAGGLKGRALADHLEWSFRVFWCGVNPKAFK